MLNTSRLAPLSLSHATRSLRSIARWPFSLAALILWALLVGIVVPQAFAEDTDLPAEPIDFGSPHPDSADELQPFAFLVGSWHCTGKVLAEDGILEPLDATLVGRYILDGRAIEDVYRQFDRTGELQHFGVTYRSYDRDGKRWVMKFHDALASSWLDLGPLELGGVEVEDGAISYQYRLNASGVVRVTFSDISTTGFQWRAELSSDGGVGWREVMTMRARPTGQPEETKEEAAP